MASSFKETELSRIGERFARLAEEGRTAMIPYLVAGDPSLEFTVPMMHRLVEAGADIIELGVPFSDPMSEGPVIQLAHERALAHGTSLRDVLELVQQFRSDDNDTPVLLMGYANPVEHFGYAAFADAASAAGIDGLLTVDLPPEEVDAVNAELHRVGMDNIFLIAPTTPSDRIGRIAASASGFIYYVSLKGVTGAGHLDVDAVSQRLGEIRGYTSLPVAVGFGIKDASSAAALAAHADGVVMGSALVKAMSTAASDPESATTEAASLAADIRRGIDSIAS